MAVVLAQDVVYDVYDGVGYLLDIRHGLFHELSENDTTILSAILQGVTATEGAKLLSTQLAAEQVNREVSALLERLETLELLHKEGRLPSHHFPPTPSSPRNTSNHGKVPLPGWVTLKQRGAGAGRIISVLNELRKGEEGLYRAYSYVRQLKEQWSVLDIQDSCLEQTAFQLIREEYWCYRLVTGIIERRIAHLIGQMPGGEGLCMIRAFALCAYFLPFGLPIRIVIARPRYGSRTRFKLHVWAELCGKPINEVLNIRDRYRVMTEFPSYSSLQD